MNPEQFREFVLKSYGSNDHMGFQAHLRSVASYGFDPLDLFVYVASNLTNTFTDDCYRWVLAISYRVCENLMKERQVSRRHDREMMGKALETMRLLFDTIDES